MPVRKPLMVMADLPRTLAPGDKVRLPLTIFAFDKSIGEVSVNVKTGGPLSPAQTTVKGKVTSPGETTLFVELQVQEKLGAAFVEVEARSGAFTANTRIDVQVRSPALEQTTVTDTLLTPGQVWEGALPVAGIDGSRFATLELSTMPPINLERRLHELIVYPHGCVEQTTSSVFPQLFLDVLTDITPEAQKVVAQNIRAGIDRLRTFQTSSGGLTYWPGEGGEASEWGSNYAGHFLVEARARGYAVPEGMLSAWIRYQKRMSESWRQPDGGGSSWYSLALVRRDAADIQAYRLYTLARAGEPALGAMNRMRGIANLNETARWQLAGAYWLAGQRSAAQELVKGLAPDLTAYVAGGFTYGSELRDRARILEVLSLMGMRTQAGGVMKRVASELSTQDYLPTQTAAYALMAAAKFVAEVPLGDRSLKADLRLGAGQPVVKVLGQAAVARRDLVLDAAGSTHFRVANSGTTPLFVRVVRRGMPRAGQEQQVMAGLSVSVDWQDEDGMTIDPASLKAGSDVLCIVTVQNPTNAYLNELALTQLFPSGWEIREALEGSQASEMLAGSLDYQDVRDDRVLSYFDLGPGSVMRMKLRLNATFTGSWYLPGAQVDAMYEPAIQARLAGKATVVRAE